MPAFVDLTGKKFGRLTVLAKAGKHSSCIQYWCECECGQLSCTKASHLNSGNTRSCGCLVEECKPTLTHGMTKTKEHRCWAGMKSRCTDPNNVQFPRYS